jgi:hypothetical protein
MICKVAERVQSDSCAQVRSPDRMRATLGPGRFRGFSLTAQFVTPVAASGKVEVVQE